MSLWWARKEQLDEYQIRLIENLPLRENHLILGPPGSGKTNILLRRAQFVRSQGMPNVLVVTFTRSLAEFVKTGCFDSQGREIFPESCVTTLESWIRWLYDEHDAARPDPTGNFVADKLALVRGALDFVKAGRIPKFDALFIDEAQDLMPEEAQLLSLWSPVLFFVGDDRQKIYNHTRGLAAVRQIVPTPAEETLPFHYRLAPELCEMADKIMIAQGGVGLAATCHYNGPKPGHIKREGPHNKIRQMQVMAGKLKGQIRAYGDFIQQGEFLAVIVARKDDRQTVLDFLEQDEALAEKSQIVRARNGEEDDPHDPSIDPDKPICILTVQGCKGLEFRAVHWIFCEELSHHHGVEHYYTVVTRAKTSLDLYFEVFPQVLARAYTPPEDQLW